MGYRPEADFYFSIIERKDVPRTALILEKEATNTLENVLLSVRARNAKNINSKSLVLCALSPLLRRSCATFKKQFPDIAVYSSAFVMPSKELLTPTRLRRVIGEFDRFQDYAGKGDITAVTVPESVRDAVEKVKAALS